MSNKSVVLLNKYLAQCGIASRRHACELVTQGQISINNTVVVNPFHEVADKDVVRLKKKVVRPEQKVYLLFNKPKGCITTVHDPQGRQTVMDFLKKAPKKRLYPVGRLDYNSTGLLLITNCGELTQKLAHPGSKIKKTYHVTLTRNLDPRDLHKIKKGLRLDDGPVFVDEASYLSRQSKQHIKIVLHSGKNRVIRRMFDFLSYRVKNLDRIGYAGLTLSGLSRGHWRYLSNKEIGRLRSN